MTDKEMLRELLRLWQHDIEEMKIQCQIFPVLPYTEALQQVTYWPAWDQLGEALKPYFPDTWSKEICKLMKIDVRRMKQELTEKMRFENGRKD